MFSGIVSPSLILDIEELRQMKNIFYKQVFFKTACDVKGALRCMMYHVFCGTEIIKIQSKSVKSWGKNKEV